MQKKLLILALAIVVILTGIFFFSSLSRELQGSWINTEITFTFSGKHFVVSSPNLQESIAEGTFTLNKKARPKEINFIVEKSDEHEGKIALGIYKLEEGILTLAINEPGKITKPTSFTQQELALFTLIKE